MDSRISYQAINSKYVTWIFYDEYTELKEWDSLQDAETYIRKKEKEEDNKMNKLMYSAEEVNQILFEITLEKAKLEECIKEIKDFCSISPSTVFPSDIIEIVEKYER